MDKPPGRRSSRASSRTWRTGFPTIRPPGWSWSPLHYSRNAYRKAESALEEARRRAPHDDRLLDLQAVGFLKSADQSRRKGRFALAARDLQRAEDLGRNVLGPVLPAKTLLLEVVSGGKDATATVTPHLQRLPPGAQLRTLALLIRDLHDNSHISNVRPEMGAAVRGLLAEKAALAGEGSPDEIARLLDPLPAALDILYDDRRLAPIFVSWWPALLKRLDADRLPPVLDTLMECGGRTQVRAEIEQAVRGPYRPIVRATYRRLNANPAATLARSRGGTLEVRCPAHSQTRLDVAPPRAPPPPEPRQQSPRHRVVVLDSDPRARLGAGVAGRDEGACVP